MATRGGISDTTGNTNKATGHRANEAIKQIKKDDSEFLR